MMPVSIKGSKNNITAKVTSFGQLVVAPIAYSTPKTLELNVIDTAFNFITPKQGSSIVITDIIVSADKDVSNTDPASIEIYTAEEADSITVIDSILQPQLLRSRNLSVTGLNLLVGEGLWVNAKTNDNTIRLTIMFYRIPVGVL